MGWRKTIWVLGLVCVGVLARLVCAAGEPAAGPRLVPLKFQMQLPWSSGSHMVHPLTQRPDVEQPPQSLPVLMVPEGTINLAAEMPVTSSDREPIVGGLEAVTDGQVEYVGDLELGHGVQWVQIDLRASCPIYAIRVLHVVDRAVYFDVIIQISDDPNFERDVRTVFNNDHDGSSGRGRGTDRLYVESRFGKTVPVPGIAGRHVRLYSDGSTHNGANHYIEVEVYGVPTQAWRQQVAIDRAHWRTPEGLLGRLHARHPGAAIYDGDHVIALAGWLYCDEDFEAVAQIPTLRSLSIKGSAPPQRVTPAGVGRLKDLKALTKLEVERSRPLLDALLEHLPSLHALEELNLNFSAQPSDLPQITRLKKLRKLSLWGCQMSNDDLAQLAVLEDLEDLCIVANPVTDASVVHLRKLTKLKRLDLRFTGFTPAGWDALQQALPDLYLHADPPPAHLRTAPQ